MNILWLSWKDHQHPLAGGAEVVLRELSKRLIADGHTVTILTAEYGNESRTTTLDGLTIIRIGRSRYLHSFQALTHYLRRLRNKFDVVIEVVNTAPYFSALFGGTAQTYLFYHQLAKEIWFHETIFPLNRLGFHVLEPVATKLLSKSSANVITISESTKQDLVRHGFKAEHISIISEGIEIEPVEKLENKIKFAKPTVLSLGALRPMKRTLEQVQAFELAKQRLPELQMVIAGDNASAYGKQVTEYCAKSRFSKDIKVMGRVSLEEKIALMRRAHLAIFSSLKEGWCLVVTEAASQGTPSVVYDVDGLRDSVRHKKTGIVTSPYPAALANGILEALENKQSYQRLRKNAWEWSKEITFEQSYIDFKKIVGIAA